MVNDILEARPAGETEAVAGTTDPQPVDPERADSVPGASPGMVPSGDFFASAKPTKPFWKKQLGDSAKAAKSPSPRQAGSAKPTKPFWKKQLGDSAKAAKSPSPRQAGSAKPTKPFWQKQITFRRKASDGGSESG